MKLNFANGKLIVRFTMNFILHQILLFLVASLPAIFYIVVLNQPQKLLYVNVVTVIIIIVYFLYCLFYGYYVARPMADILINIKKLSRNEYITLNKKGSFKSVSSRLYQEVYENLESLSKILQENERKRKEYEQLRYEWASGITHDLKTPLSYISGYTDILLSDEHKWNEEEKNDFLKIIKDMSSHLKELIDDLGIAFRMDQGIDINISSERIELVELIRRVVAETANMPSAIHNTFEILGGNEPIYILGDSKLIRRAFSNLLVNSIVHNNDGTAITINIQCDDYIIVEIIDNGKGMSNQEIDNLFDRYYRGTSTNTPSGSTGLGMAIVKQIISAHQGIIDVKSKLGYGTSITVKLPQV